MHRLAIAGYHTIIWWWEGGSRTGTVPLSVRCQGLQQNQHWNCCSDPMYSTVNDTCYKIVVPIAQIIRECNSMNRTQGKVLLCHQTLVLSTLNSSPHRLTRMANCRPWQQKSTSSTYPNTKGVETSHSPMLELTLNWPRFIGDYKQGLLLLSRFGSRDTERTSQQERKLHTPRRFG